MMKFLTENWFLIYGWCMYVAGLFIGFLIRDVRNKNDNRRD